MHAWTAAAVSTMVFACLNIRNWRVISLSPARFPLCLLRETPSACLYFRESDIRWLQINLVHAITICATLSHSRFSTQSKLARSGFQKQRSFSPMPQTYAFWIAYQEVFRIQQKSFDMKSKLLAPPVGLEPTTLRLTAACSANWAKEEYLM